MPGSSPEDNGITDDTVVATAAQASETATTDVSITADSSTAEAKGEGDLLATVKAALDPKSEKSPDSDKPGSESEEDPAKAASKDSAEKAETDPDELTEAELAQLRPKTRKRIDNLLRDRNDRDRKISEIEPKAQQYDQINRFVAEAGLSKDEVNDGFAVMRDLRNDPRKAYERLKPIFTELRNMFGEGDLPADLQQDVATGRITEDRARELVAARSHTSLSAAQVEQNTRRQADVDRQSNVSEVSTAVTEWERTKEKADPSWKLKQPRVMELVELEIVRKQRDNPGYFPTKSEALKFSNDALDKVNKEFQAIAPKPRAITPNVDAGSSRTVAKPTSAVEAAKQALAQAS